MTAAQENEQRFFTACMRGGPLSPRLALYRRLVRGTVRGVAVGVLPRTSDALETLGSFERSLDAFLHERGPATPYVRDVPFELVAHASSGWPAWVQELARLELAEFATSYAPRGEPPTTRGIALDAPLTFARPVTLETFAHAVQSETPHVPDLHVLLFYRDAHEHVRTLRLSAMAAALLQVALTGESLQHALIAASAATGIVLDEAVLASTATLLDDLGERGIVLV